MKKCENCYGVMVCSGLSHEIFPATLSIPKALYPIGDTPLILIGLSHFYSLGIRNVVLVISRSDRTAIECLVGNGEILGMSINYYYQDIRHGLTNLLRSLLKIYPKIVLRMVDFISTNLTNELVCTKDNLVFESNSNRHFYDGEYIFDSKVVLNENFDSSFKNNLSLEVRKSLLKNPLYLYTCDDLFEIIKDNHFKILDPVKLNFGQTFLFDSL